MHDLKLVFTFGSEKYYEGIINLKFLYIIYLNFILIKEKIGFYYYITIIF